MKLRHCLYLFICLMLAGIFFACTTAKAPSVIHYQGHKIGDYSYFYFRPTPDIASETGVYGTQYGVFRDEMGGVNQTFNPEDIVSDKLIKSGFKKVDEITPEIKKSTLYITFGENERTNFDRKHTKIVAIQFLDADTQEPVVVCSAECQGSSRVEDVRKAIKRSMDALLKPLAE